MFVKRLTVLATSLLLLSSIVLAPLSHVLAATASAPNLIANPLVETPNPSSPTLPLDWADGSWGTNTTTFAYEKTGSTGDSNSLNVSVSNFTSGAAEWYFNPVSIQAGATYTFSDTYESTVASEVDAAFNMSDGSTQYLYLGTPAVASSWAQFSDSFTAPQGATSAVIYHLLYGNGSLTTDNYSLTQTSLPQVSLVTPVANATVSGNSVALSATATDASGVIASVQFQVDGQNVGTPVTVSPYQYNWNSTTVTNATHSITAVATSTAGQTVTSTPVTVTVSNPVVVSSNIVPNPTLNTPDPNNPTSPASWFPVTWGTNTTTFSYLKSGYDDTNSLKAQITNYTTGASEWMFVSQPVAADTQYKFSDYYKSNIASEVEIMFNMSDGSQLYEMLGLPSTSTSWKQFTTVFNAPLGAQSFSVYQFIQKVGYVTTDDYSVAPYTPVGFNRALVTLTFDDGYANTFTSGLPLLQKYGFTSTQFIITDVVGYAGYVTSQNLVSMDQAGEEVASHTVTHDDMTQETASTLTTELSSSQKQLKTWTGAAITDIAYPYGLYNSTVQTKTAKYYTGARGVEPGLNSKDVFNQYDLKVENVFDTTTTAQVADWVQQAKNTNTWLIIVYHSVSATPTDSNNVTPTQLDSQLAAIKASGVTVENMNTALAEVLPQVTVK